MFNTDKDYIKLDRVQRHSEESVKRMEDKIDNTSGTEYYDRAVARLAAFEVRVTQEIANIRARIQRKESPPPRQVRKPRYRDKPDRYRR